MLKKKNAASTNACSRKNLKLIFFRLIQPVLFSDSQYFESISFSAIVQQFSRLSTTLLHPKLWK
jgi:hypothetical protein